MRCELVNFKYVISEDKIKIHQKSLNNTIIRIKIQIGVKFLQRKYLKIETSGFNVIIKVLLVLQYLNGRIKEFYQKIKKI